MQNIMPQTRFLSIVPASHSNEMGTDESPRVYLIDNNEGGATGGTPPTSRPVWANFEDQNFEKGKIQGMLKITGSGTPGVTRFAIYLEKRNSPGTSGMGDPRKGESPFGTLYEVTEIVAKLPDCEPHPKYPRTCGIILQEQAVEPSSGSPPTPTYQFRIREANAIGENLQRVV